MKTEQLTHTEIMLRFANNNTTVNIYWNGGNYCSYELIVNKEVIASGNDFRPSPLHHIDDNQSIVSLLGFLTVRPGGADPDYFKDHSAKHMKWLDSSECQDLELMVGDFENGEIQDGHDYKAAAIAFFKQHTVQYPEN